MLLFLKAQRLNKFKLITNSFPHHRFFSQYNFCGEETDAAVIQRTVREAHVSELAITSFFEALSTSTGNRPDIEIYADQEREQLHVISDLIPRHRARPSLLQPLFTAAASALGTMAAVLPDEIRNSVIVGIHEASSERANDQLRELRERGIQKQVPDLRSALKDTRDLPRVPAGVPELPDLLQILASAKENGKLEIPSGIPGVVGATVKLVAQTSLVVASHF